MGLFKTTEEFVEYEQEETLEIMAYGRLVASIMKNHDLRQYGNSKDVQCKGCLADLGFLIYTKKVGCEAGRPRPRKTQKMVKKPSKILMDKTTDDFSLTLQ